MNMYIRAYLRMLLYDVIWVGFDLCSMSVNHEISIFHVSKMQSFLNLCHTVHVIYASLWQQCNEYLCTWAKSNSAYWITELLNHTTAYGAVGCHFFKKYSDKIKVKGELYITTRTRSAIWKKKQYKILEDKRIFPETNSMCLLLIST